MSGEFHRGYDAEIAVVAAATGPEKLGLVAGVLELALAVDHANALEVVAGQAVFAGE